ncbi:hypothetical protein cypCar_00017238 [Cyprinus carpio]|nr:hypothetical protein cypCar_00017238 [Cyprinus carpio]
MVNHHAQGRHMWFLQDQVIYHETSGKDKADSIKLFTDLMRSIERCQSELLEMMEQKQKSAEKQAELMIKELEQEITELKRRDTELEQLSHTEDHLHLLQIYPSLIRPPCTSTEIIISDTQLSVETLRKGLVQLEETLDEKLSKSGKKSPILFVSTVLERIQQHAEGFSSGRFYFEMQVKGKTDWDLGVARESINRKGIITSIPEAGYWIVVLRNGNQYLAALSNELQCSICLDLFTDPVSTPCGHNFCKNCLNQCWNNSQTYNCPFCKETFSKRPDLKINTALRQVVQHIKEKSGLSKSEVLCDFCDDIKMKALKMCLVCQSSYCETHLEPHQRVAHLKKHKLIDPEANLEDYICQKHEKPLELFCRDDQTCVCLLCAMKDHKNHNTVAVEEECGEREPQLMKMQTEVRQMIQNRIKRIQDIRHLKEVKNESSEKEKADSTELFTDLMRSIERCQSELLKMMEQKQKAAGKQAEELIKELEQEITELKRRDTELEQLSHTEDHLHLLQIYPSLIRPKFTSSWSEISISDTQLSVETLRKALIQLQETLDEKLSKSVQKTMQHAGTKVSDAESVPKTMQLYGVDVTLDPDTAHPNLILFDHGKQVRYGDINLELPDNPERFDYCPCVLAKEGFSSGRFYFEVQCQRP